MEEGGREKQAQNKNQRGRFRGDARTRRFFARGAGLEGASAH
jgi:hypothetical protein